MGLLRVLHLAVPAARLRREIVGAVELRHLLASGCDGRLRERRRVGAHVGDVAVLVQALRDAHRRLRRVAQLAARLLLQRRGAERRSRLAGVGLLVLAADRERRVLQPLEQPARRLLVQVREILGLRLSVGAEVRAAGDALAVERDEARVERARVEDPLEVPVGDLDERDPLALALDDQPGRDRLHAPRREPLRDLLPEHRRDLVAVEAVEDPPGLLRVDQPVVDLAASRPSERSIASRVISWKTIRRTGTLGFSTWSRCQAIASPSRSSSVASSSSSAPFSSFLSSCDRLLLVVVDEVERLEVLVDRHPHRPVLGPLLLGDVAGPIRQIADVADARGDLVALAEVALDRPRFGGRLDDHQAVRTRFSPWLPRDPP